MPAYVYILASKKNGTLYIGVTSNLIQRSSQHKIKTYSGFTEKYGVDKLVHYEVFADIRDAIAREKHLKKWRRAWKVDLIEKTNPEWRDQLQKFAASFLMAGMDARVRGHDSFGPSGYIMSDR